ncbi:hybrid sensor histidine kinase/response regulator [Catenovulum sediminis]|uniref:histidine kinase n=1 Tax=Catenovulum sediminis TaxID=1740262 RepID=A0ABV1RG49_9ALTE|nr:response regulator [Catenovulum sediminis]
MVQLQLVRFFGWLIVFLGCLVIFGWHMQLVALVQLLPSLVPMQYNTALGFILLGLSLLISNKLLKTFCCSFIALIATLTLIQYIAGVDFSIDQLFMQHYITQATSHPGRMAPNTAICFILMSLVLTPTPDKYKNFYQVFLTKFILAAVTLFLSFVALAGYLLNISAAFGWGYYTQMALHTSIGFILGSSTYLLTLHNGERFKITRHMLIMAIATQALCAMCIISWQAIHKKEMANVQQHTQSIARQFESDLAHKYQYSYNALQRMANRLHFTDYINTESWQNDAESYLFDQPWYEGILLLDKNIKRVAERFNDDIISDYIDTLLDLPVVKQALRKAKLNLSAATSNWFILPDGKAYFVIVNPYGQVSYDNYLLAIISFEKLIYKNNHNINWQDIRLYLSQKEQVIFQFAVDNKVDIKQITATEIKVENIIPFGGNEYNIQILPTANLTARYLSNIPTTILVIMLLLSFCLLLTYHTSHQERHKKRCFATLNNQMSRVTGNAALGIWHWNLLDDSLEWDANMLNIYKVPDTQVNQGLSYLVWKEYVHEDDIERVETALLKAFNNKEAWHDEFRIKTTDGSVKHIKADSFVEFNKFAEPIAIIGSNLDITEIKREQLRLAESRRSTELELSINRAIIGNISHEFRTQLNSITGFLQMQHNQIENAGNTVSPQSILHSASNLLAAIDDITDYMSLSQNQLKLKYQTFNLQTEIERVIADIKPAASMNNVRISLDLTKKCNKNFIGDPARIYKIFYNLLNYNAKRLENAIIEIRVDVHADMTSSNQIIEFEMSDNGVALPQMAIETLFQPKQQMDARHLYGYSGLGLTLAAKLARRMKGDISVTSCNQYPTTFHISLPLKLDTDILKPSITDAGTQIALELPNLKGKTILIAEDELINQAVIQALIEPSNANIIMVNNGLEVLDKIKPEPDLILLDIRMPQMDGPSTCVRLRDIGYQKPILALTANVLEEDIESYLQLGFTAHLAKPIMLDELYKVLSQYLMD